LAFPFIFVVALFFVWRMTGLNGGRICGWNGWLYVMLFLVVFILFCSEWNKIGWLI
jgi:hypothetical protein